MLVLSQVKARQMLWSFMFHACYLNLSLSLRLTQIITSHIHCSVSIISLQSLITREYSITEKNIHAEKRTSSSKVSLVLYPTTLGDGRLEGRSWLGLDNGAGFLGWLELPGRGVKGPICWCWKRRNNGILLFCLCQLLPTRPDSSDADQDVVFLLGCLWRHMVLTVFLTIFWLMLFSFPAPWSITII